MHWDDSEQEVGQNLTHSVEKGAQAPFGYHTLWAPHSDDTCPLPKGGEIEKRGLCGAS